MEHSIVAAPTCVPAWTTTFSAAARLWRFTLLALILAACSPAPAMPSALPGSQAVAPDAASPPAAATRPPAEAAPALILAERQASIDGDLALLRQLWAPDARIIDGRGTPAPNDDYVWAGRDAILDRYVLAVFPAPPPPLAPEDLAALALIVDDETEGDAITSARVELGVDHWRLTWRDERWQLLELRYN